MQVNAGVTFPSAVVVLERIPLELNFKSNAGAHIQMLEVPSSHLNGMAFKEPENMENLFSTLQNSENSGNCKMNYVPYINIKQKVEKKLENSAQAKLNDFDRAITLFDQIDRNNNENWKENLLHHGAMIKLADVTELKSLNMMKMIVTNKLVQFVKNLELTIKEGETNLPILLSETSMNNVETSLKLVEVVADSCLTLLYIMTSPEMPKRIYLEEIINSIVSFINFFLCNMVFPLFDDSYNFSVKENCKQAVFRMKRGNLSEETKMVFYAKSESFIELFLELLDIQILTETAIFRICLVAFSSLSVENIKGLQLSFMKLLTNVFSLYEKHRIPLLEMCLTSMCHLSNDKRQMRNYRLYNGKYIHIFSALFVQFTQSVTILPKNFYEKDTFFGSTTTITTQIDEIIFDKYEQARIIAGTFLTMLLNKCDKKLEDSNCKILFENLIYDLLAMINKPEWPSTDLILTILGIILINNISNKDTDVGLRMICLEFLSILIVKFRENNKSLQDSISTIEDQINIKLQDLSNKENVEKEPDKNKYLQQIILYYLFVNSEVNEFHTARHFLIIQWYINIKKSKSEKKESPPLKAKSKIRRSKNKKTMDEEGMKIKKDLINMLQPVLENPIRTICKNLNHESAELIVQHLTSKRDFLENFDQSLKSIILLLKESAIVVRIKTLKCLMMIIETDMSVLTKHEVQIGINHTFLDQSAAVREVTAELVGKFILKQPELINDYYDMLSARILDTSVSVRKRIIRIFHGVCTKFTDFDKITEIYIKIIRRINDEESVQRLVMEVFLNIWFTPCNSKLLLLQKVTSIINVVKSCDETHLASFRKLLLSLYKLQTNNAGSETKDPLSLAFKQIIQHLIKNLSKTKEDVVISLIILHIFSQIQPQLIVEYARILQPYLNSNHDIKMISTIIQIFEQIVPVIPQQKLSFLYELEEDLMQLILKHDRSVVAHSLSCLGLLTNKTRNFRLIRNCFKRCYSYLTHFKSCISDDKSDDAEYQLYFRRTLFIIGLLLKYFDFDDPAVIGELPHNIRQEVFELFLFFLQQDDEDIQLNTLKGIGLACLRHNEFLLNNTLKEFYHHVLISEEVSFPMKLSVLKNIEMYITEVNTHIAAHDSKVINKITEEGLKKIETSSEMINTTINYYINDILQSYLDFNLQIRQVAVRLVQIIIQQGVTHPVQAVPYLICMSSDNEKVISNNADKQLLEINRTYPGYIRTKSLLGVKLSYQLQEKLLKIGIIRGFKVNSTNEYPSAMNGFLYSLLRGFKQQRRSFILNILQQFDQDKNLSLSYLLYLADNLAYFSYTNQEELLFLIHHIDRIVAYAGECILLSFKQGLKSGEDGKTSNNDDINEASFISKEDEDETVLLDQLPDDISSLQSCLLSAQKVLLLLLLKQHLKQIYGVTDYKIQQYCPMDLTKLYDKPISRRKNLKFDPKSIITQLQQGSSFHSSNANEREHLVHQYLYFKELMLEYDSTNPDIEANYNRNTLNSLSTTSHISQSSELKKEKCRNTERQRIKVNKRRRKRQKLTYSSNKDYDTEESDSE